MQAILDLDINSLSQQERLGTSKNFSQVVTSLQPIHQMLIEIIQIIKDSVDMPILLINGLHPHIGGILNMQRIASEYKIEDDNNFVKWQSLINTASNFASAAILGVQPNTNPPQINNFLNLYAAIKSFAISDYEKIKKLVSNQIGLVTDQSENFKLALKQLVADKDKILTESKLTFDKVNSLFEEMQNRAKELVSQTYADIFKKESNGHSKSANIWLGIAIGSVALLLVIFFKVDGWLGIKYDDASTKSLPYLIATKVLLLSFLIYVASLFFKQFTINKHLATSNRHRQNTLESYKLLIESMDDNSPEVKNTILLEVAKAIYELGQTGYLGKSSADGAPSLIELTRIIGEKKQS